MSNWELSNRCDPNAARLADRHYSRQTIGSPHFVPPGRCLVLHQPGAYWVTSWPFAEYTKHEWAGAWICSAFRNEGAGLSSVLIREAIAHTLHRWAEPPTLGMITFVDAKKVRPKRNPGMCFIHAGFKRVRNTKGGLLAFQLLPGEMPPPSPAIGQTLHLFGPKEANT